MPRPLWSVMIPTFHCARFLRQTLESVLSQDPGPDVMQIEVIDDCSTQDDPESVVRAIAGERVHFFQQPKMSVTRVILKLVFSVLVVTWCICFMATTRYFPDFTGR